MVSFPHFYLGDPRLLEEVEGLKPDPEKHDFYLDVHEVRFYILLTVHLRKILVNNQLDALFSMYLFNFPTCFEQPSVHHQENRILSVHQPVYITLCRWPGMPIPPDRHTRKSQDGTTVPSWLCLEAVIKTYMKLTNAECAVENSWWWTKKLPETYRVLWQNKFGLLMRLVGYYKEISNDAQ